MLLPRFSCALGPLSLGRFNFVISYTLSAIKPQSFFLILKLITFVCLVIYIVIDNPNLIELLEVLMKDQILVLHKPFILEIIIISRLLGPWPLRFKRIHDMKVFLLRRNILFPAMLRV